MKNKFQLQQNGKLPSKFSQLFRVGEIEAGNTARRQFFPGHVFRVIRIGFFVVGIISIVSSSSAITSASIAAAGVNAVHRVNDAGMEMGGEAATSIIVCTQERRMSEHIIQ